MEHPRDPRTPLERRLDVLEGLIRENSIRSKINGDGTHELAFSPVGASRLKEWWVQRYVKQYHERLAFSAVKGRLNEGPDFHVEHRGKWFHAEVKTSWGESIRHKHH